jgi:hypothetical protein
MKFRGRDIVDDGHGGLVREPVNIVDTRDPRSTHGREAFGDSVMSAVAASPVALLITASLK